MPSSAQRRVHVCPVEALAAVSAEARAWIPDHFRSRFSVVGHVSSCPPEAAARLEAWLMSTRGAELRKAKSFDTALRSMAHATYVWSFDATRLAGADDLTRRPETHLRHLSLPGEAPAIHGHSRGGFRGRGGGSAGHLVGRGGKFIKPLLERYPQVRVYFGGDTVNISGPLAADVELVAGELHARLAQMEERAKLARAKKLESELRRLRANNPALTLLFLHGHDLGAEGAAHMAGALHDNTVLKSLHLECNDLGDEGAAHLAGALHVNTALENLNLSDNGIGDAGAAQLAALLHVNTVLTMLELRNNSIGDEGAAQLAAALHVNTSLTHLELAENRLGAEGAAHLAGALYVNTSLTRLSLKNNSSDPRILREVEAEVEAACDANRARLDEKRAAEERDEFLRRLSANDVDLTFMYLESNELSAAGAAQLAGALHDNTVLKSLHLECNDLGDEGAAHLAGALHVNTALENLNLSDNGIGDAGAAQLAALLHVNTVLTMLELRNNSIGDEGAAQLAAALHVNTVLTDLDLQYNIIGDQGLREVQAACDANWARRDDDSGVDGGLFGGGRGGFGGSIFPPFGFRSLFLYCLNVLFHRLPACAQEHMWRARARTAQILMLCMHTCA
jgi:Ran GTPase-activating protein (RanGAP) involved in mRNA processing and transport